MSEKRANEIVMMFIERLLRSGEEQNLTEEQIIYVLSDLVMDGTDISIDEARSFTRYMIERQ
ncbi:MAG: hypothetical protein KAT32_00585 [Candidatus Moranbacteria bacterium]|nr:hypothetical protein [Candidatus Moranbacteria bacterium]